MKKLICILLLICLIPLSGCGTSEENSDKVKIVASLFPQYDFARQIGGDFVEVSLLLPPGADSHHYDPTPSDILSISRSDLFIYTGSNMEPWVSNIASNAGEGVTVLDVSESLNIISAHSHDGEEHSSDPHIWLDFDNAKMICESICDALITLMPENEAYFKNNLLEYKTELTKLDEEYSRLFASSDKTLVFGGKFALSYLMHRYNASYKTAYASCSANSEPSIQDIVYLSEFVKNNNISVIYCEEYSDPKVAREIAVSNNCEVLVIHSCHNVNREDKANNETFVSLMSTNLENLRKGLS